MIVKDGQPWVAFGVMGGDNQAQAHAQVVIKLVDFGLHVQAAGDAARVRHTARPWRSRAAIGDDVRASSNGAATRSATGAARWAATRRCCVDPAERRAARRIGSAQGRTGHRLVSGATRCVQLLTTRYSAQLGGRGRGGRTRRAGT